MVYGRLTDHPVPYVLMKKESYPSSSSFIFTVYGVYSVRNRIYFLRGRGFTLEFGGHPFECVGVVVVTRFCEYYYVSFRVALHYLVPFVEGVERAADVECGYP